MPAADTLRVATQGADSALPISITSPQLPGGVAAVFRFFFHVPQWIQIGGLVGGVIGAIALVWYCWTRRAPIAAWVRSRPGSIQTALLVALVVVVSLAAGTGVRTW